MSIFDVENSRYTVLEAEPISLTMNVVFSVNEEDIEYLVLENMSPFNVILPRTLTVSFSKTIFLKLVIYAVNGIFSDFKYRSDANSLKTMNFEGCSFVHVPLKWTEFNVLLFSNVISLAIPSILPLLPMMLKSVVSEDIENAGDTLVKSNSRLLKTSLHSLIVIELGKTYANVDEEEKLTFVFELESAAFPVKTNDFETKIDFKASWETSQLSESTVIWFSLNEESTITSWFNFRFVNLRLFSGDFAVIVIE